MYGLSSRESLSTRQSRWIRDLDEEVRAFPAQKAIKSEKKPDHLTGEDIISLTTSSMELEQLSRTVSDLSDRYKLLEKKYDSLKSVVASSMDQSAFLEKQNSNRKKEVKDIYTRINRDIPDLIARLSVAERSINSLSTPDRSVEDQAYTESPLSEYCEAEEGVCVNSSEFSTLTDETDVMEFIPYYIDDEFKDECNKCVLNGANMKFIVKVNGLYDDEPLIYPFGDDTNIPDFMDLNIKLNLSDNTEIIKGSAYGNFHKNDDGIYLIKITDIYSDGESSELDKFVLPLVISCDTDLVLN